MAAGIQTDFVGGPCDGQTKRLTQTVIDSGEVQCGGEHYIIQGVTRTLYRATYQPTPGLVPNQIGPRGSVGWTDWMSAIGRDLPLALRRSQAARSAALRRLGK